MQDKIRRTTETSAAQTGRHTGRDNAFRRSLPPVIAAKSSLLAFPSQRSMLAELPGRASAKPSKTKGWPWKALEFINSGPPALLNNPRRSHRRGVIFPFLKHAMEVHYG
ncbi:MAG: hypothetical protein AB1800_09175 [Pseudomonadota bacterium]|jgi:hypothetical protein